VIVEYHFVTFHCQKMFSKLILAMNLLFTFTGIKFNYDLALACNDDIIYLCTV